MNKYFKRIVIVALSIVSIFAIATQFFAATIYKQDGFLYSVTSFNSADLYGRETDDANLVIPKEFNDHYITNIVDSAFAGDENITSLSFAKAINLQRIGYLAFSNCKNLSGNVYFSGKITNLGISAFQNCTSLESIKVISMMISVIPEQCFYNCISLSAVQLSDYVTRIDKFAFANTAIKEITIPKSVTYIDKTAFDGCEGLVINCYTGSYAQQFAEENGIDYVLIDAPAPTEPSTEPPTQPETEPVTEASTEPVTEPVTEPATEQLGYLLGDVDNNGAVEIYDATWLQRYLANIKLTISEESIMQGEVDGDGELSIYDVTFIQRYVVDIPTPYPIGEFIAI